MKIDPSYLDNPSLASFLWDIGKQWRGEESMLGPSLGMKKKWEYAPWGFYCSFMSGKG